jgi:hypothetical protein
MACLKLNQNDMIFMIKGVHFLLCTTLLSLQNVSYLAKHLKNFLSSYVPWTIRTMVTYAEINPHLKKQL